MHPIEYAYYHNKPVWHNGIQTKVLALIGTNQAWLKSKPIYGQWVEFNEIATEPP